MCHYNPETGEPLRMRLALSDGYLSTRVTYDDGRPRTVFAHRLVAVAFLGPRPSTKHLVRHLDDVRTKNILSDLAYGTKSENIGPPGPS